MTRSNRTLNRSRARRRFRRIFLEQLEDRSLLAATITVNSVLDTNARDSVLTLREAISISNRTLAVGSLTNDEAAQVTGTPTSTDTDTISFNISGSGVHTIRLASDLPTIIDTIVIDGYTQPDSMANSDPSAFNGKLQIELTPVPDADVANGLSIASDNSVIRGLVINGFTRQASIWVAAGTNNVIQGNFLGTDSTGTTSVPSRSGVELIGGSGTLIGGSEPAARNLISGNEFAGIRLIAASQRLTTSTAIRGNLIGTDLNGKSSIGNGDGISFLHYALDTVVGGPNTGDGNVISGNRNAGISLGGFSDCISAGMLGLNSTGTTVQGNKIGTDVTGSQPLGNGANGISVAFQTVSTNTIGGTTPGAGNIIAFNGIHGVAIAKSGAQILSNSIFSNTQLGIHLGVLGCTAAVNDAGDADSGPNNLQNYPVISSVAASASQLTVAYSVPSTTSKSAYPLRVEFFKADAGGQEGKTFLGFDTYTSAEATSAKNVSFTSAAAVAVGDKIVATATDNVGNTSEFNVNATVQSGTCSTVVINTNDTGSGSFREAINCANSKPGPDTITFAIPANDPRHFYYKDDFLDGGLKNITATPAPDDATISDIDVDWRHSWYSIEVSTSLPTITEAVSINGYSQPGAIVNSNGVGLVDNAVLRVELAEAASSIGTGISGLSIAANASTISGLAIKRFDNHGIQIRSNNNAVAGNFIGTDISGTLNQGNGGDGINISASSSNLVGGTAVSVRNLIGNNLRSGVALISGASQNQVWGNSIFHNAGGNGVNSNPSAAGVLMDEADHNTVGGAESGAGNLINGNASGVLILGASAHHNLVLGNSVGPVNGNGVVIRNAHDNIIGGTTKETRNTISGNGGTGVVLDSTNPLTPTSNNVVQGNYIGTDATGTQKVANSYMGVRIEGESGGSVTNNVIGGVAAGAGNVISGNNLRGILVGGSLAIGNLIQGNFVGTQAGGIGRLGNTQVGIEIFSGAHDNIIGGPIAGSGNIISANGADGVWIDGVGSINNLVQGNYVGTDLTGTLDLGNITNGVEIWDQATDNAVLDNIVSGNGGRGIILSFGVNRSVLQGNSIGVAADRTSALTNGLDGILIDGGQDNKIGGVSDGLGNIIAFNGGDGINVSSFGSARNAILTNSIFSNGELGIDLDLPAQIPPAISSAASNGGPLTMQYSVQSTARYPLRVEFFKADSAGQEGQTFLGFDTYLAAEATATKTVTLVATGLFKRGDKILATATDNIGNTSEFSASLLIQITNSLPVIISNNGGDSASISAKENTTAVADVDATDADAAQTLTYSIVGGTDSGKFSIDPSNGVLTFATAPNFENPTDSDTNNVYQVVVSASDGFDTDTQALAITVTNVNEPPVITSNGGGATISVSVAENTSVAADIDAVDPEKSSLAYSKIGGVDSSKFSINPSTGVLTFLSPPDFENPTDTGKDNAYDVVVRVSDGSLSTSQTITVTITNVNDGPTITSNGGGATAAINVLENAFVVSDVNATGEPGTTVTYGISGGADAAKFAIDATTGLLSFLTAPNFENPTDVGGNRVYDVLVTASDGVATDTQTIAITVTDANESPLPQNDNLETSENSSLTIAPSTLLSNDLDPDAGDAITFLSVGGSIAWNEAIDGDLPVSGAVPALALRPGKNEVRGATGDTANGGSDLDHFVFEVPAGAQLTSITITASRVVGAIKQLDWRLSNDASVDTTMGFVVPVTNTGLFSSLLPLGPGKYDFRQIDYLKVVDNTDFALANYSFKFTVAASAGSGNQFPLPSGAMVTLQSDGTLSYDPHGSFESLKAGQTTTDSFTYTVIDRQGEIGTATVSVRIHGENDAPVAGDDQFSTDEDTGLTIQASELLANDHDAELDGLTLTPRSQPQHGQLMVRLDGSFRYLPQQDFNGADSFTYQLSDGQTLSNLATVTLAVNAVNDRPVVSLGNDVSVNEGTTFSAQGSFADADSGDSWTATVNYGDGTGGSLTLTANKTFALGHAYKENGNYTVTVSVQDGGQLTGSASFQAHVQNVAPQQLMWSGPTQATIGESVVFTGSFTDPGILDTETASIDWGDGKTSDATVTGGNGVWQISASHIYVGGGAHSVTVTVKDDDGDTATKSVSIGLGAGVLVAGVLQITGSEQRDDLKLTLSNTLLVMSGTIAGTSVTQNFPLASVQRIMVELRGGDDSFTVDAKIKQPLLVTAGDGNDFVQAGGGPAVIIGGAGQDTLNGGAKSDLLIAGTTSYDANATALAAILSEWSSSRLYTARTKNLKTGIGPVLQGTGISLVVNKTVFNDTSVDTLLGNGDFDWFMSDTKKDKVRLPTRGELIN